VNKVNAATWQEVEMVTGSKELISRFNRARPASIVIPVLALILVLTVGTGEGRAAAQSDPHFTNLSVSVMPEYDQQSVLVSYRGEFNPTVSLPLDARVRLPADATIEHICSIKEPEGEHICQPYSADPDGQYLAVTWEAITPVMYVEYYYGAVSGAGERTIDYSFLPPYPVDNLDLFVMEPATASDFTLSPAPADVDEGQGFRHHGYSFQDIPADEPVNIAMSYMRESDQPTRPSRDTGAADASDSSGGIPQGVVYALSLAGAGLLAFVVGSVLVRRFRVRTVVAAHAPAGTGTAPPGDTFSCRHCGTEVRPGSAFCPGQPPPEEGPKPRPGTDNNLGLRPYISGERRLGPLVRHGRSDDQSCADRTSWLPAAR
jgi:hypothetical protein